MLIGATSTRAHSYLQQKPSRKYRNRGILRDKIATISFSRLSFSNSSGSKNDVFSKVQTLRNELIKSGMIDYCVYNNNEKEKKNGINFFFHLIRAAHTLYIVLNFLNIFLKFFRTFFNPGNIDFPSVIFVTSTNLIILIFHNANLQLNQLKFSEWFFRWKLQFKLENGNSQIGWKFMDQETLWICKEKVSNEFQHFLESSRLQIFHRENVQFNIFPASAEPKNVYG